MKDALNLLNDIILMEQERDDLFKKWAIENHKGSLALGESKILFHLKALKELIEKKRYSLTLTNFNYTIPDFKPVLYIKSDPRLKDK